MIPEKLSEACSLGVFGPPAAENTSEYKSDEEKSKIKACIFASMKNYQGDTDENISFDDLMKKLR